MEWNGKNVVWSNGEYFIALDSEKDPSYVTLWTHDNKRVGFLSTRSHPGKRDYVGISSVSVDPKHRGKRLGKQMYRVLLQFLPKHFKGISSYLPDRYNRRQVPRIWKSLGG